MVDATVSFAIQKISEFLTEEVNIRRGVKDRARWLKDELGFLQSSTRAAEANQEMDLVRQWINNVRDVANDAVIILERFAACQDEHAAPKQGVLDRLRGSICMCKKEANFYDIGKEIESLKGRVVEIKKRRDEYGIASILATPAVQQRNRTLLRATSFENQVDVVGFEDDAKTLLAELVKKDSSLNMISIHGMGGLGKSTLASKLYHSSELSQFKTRAWVCVSKDYSIKNVLRMTIKSFMGHDPDLEMKLLNLDEVDLLQYLRKLLLDCDGYLAVIDDIWDIKAWEKIKRAFPDKKNGSRIIITTRYKIVAQKVDDRCFVHELRFLRDDESWKLFSKRAEPTQNLEKLGKEMVSKCGGLPLAIVVLSGLLLHKKSYEDWSKVNDHIWRLLKGDSVEIREILSLSYNDLSFKLKQCFLYLARFPEDYDFEAHRLMQLWIAEEFISEAEEEDGVVMEDVAEDYLNELSNRNMIQIASLKLNGQEVNYRVHDLIHDLAIEKAKEERLLGIFNSSKHQSLVCSLKGQPRHVIYDGTGEYLKLLETGSDNLTLRSLAIIDKSSRLELEEIKLMNTRFKHLKVLDLITVTANGIPEEIGDLVFLKFLGLVGNDNDFKAIVIPPTIGKLKRLQTLSGSLFSIYDFPTEICELKELRHLNFEILSERRASKSLKIGSHQVKLQTLDSIWYKDWIQIDTVNLTNLHTLSIVDASEEANGYNFDSVANLLRLQIFILEFRSTIPTIKPLSSCKYLKSVMLIGRIEDPLELSFLPDSVTNLTLHGSGFTEDPMSALGSLSNLRSLDLKDVYMGEKMVCMHDAFPCLKFLILEGLPNLEEWQLAEGALPSLVGFEISKCEKLNTFPQHIKCLPPTPAKFERDSIRKFRRKLAIQIHELRGQLELLKQL